MARVAPGLGVLRAGAWCQGSGREGALLSLKSCVLK